MKISWGVLLKVGLLVTAPVLTLTSIGLTVSWPSDNASVNPPNTLSRRGETSVTRLLVVGGSDAGVSACLRARELDPSVEVSMLVADDFPNYSICGLPMFLGGEVGDWHHLAHRSRDEILSTGIALHTNTRVTDVFVGACAVRAEGPAGPVEFSYDRLILATGAEPVRPPLPGIDEEGVFLLHSIGDGLRLNTFLTSHAVRQAVIVGAGYIGCEMADALTRRGIAVTLMEQASAVLPTVDPALGAILAERMAHHGVEVLPGVRVASIEATDEGLQVHTDSGLTRPSQMVLVAVGVRPATDLARGMGLDLGLRGAIPVSRTLETAIPNVWAAGDCTETWHRLLGRPTYLPLGTTAHKQGRIAGENALGGDRLYEGTLGTQAVKVFDTVVGRTGLSDLEAREAGWEAMTAQVTTWDHKAYYPGAQPLQIRLVGDSASGRLLGAQVLGGYPGEIAKRLDVLAAAIHQGMSVQAVSDLDLSYTPPLSSPWDPIQMAAQVWESRNARSQS